jgi:hypothetical protein
VTDKRLEAVIDSAAEVAYSLTQLTNALLLWRKRPVRLIIVINQKGPTMATIQIPDDQPFSIHVVALDKFGEAATETGTFTITSSNPSFCTIAEDPAHAGDSTYAIGTPIVGEGQFVINATDGTLTGVSDELDITPGAPTQLEVQIHAA